LGNLSIPKMVQKLQKALHAKAKAEAGYRFYNPYDKISRKDILAHAYAQGVRGAPRSRPSFKKHGLRGRSPDGTVPPWEFERNGEVVQVDPAGPLVVNTGGASDLGVAAAIAGTGIVYHFEAWLRPHMDSGELEPVLEPWWQSFSGPFLYYP
jgi:DNA-binding transcriptional LysR family regulator